MVDEILFDLDGLYEMSVGFGLFEGRGIVPDGEDGIGTGGEKGGFIGRMCKCPDLHDKPGGVSRWLRYGERVKGKKPTLSSWLSNVLIHSSSLIFQSFTNPSDADVTSC